MKEEGWEIPAYQLWFQQLNKKQEEGWEIPALSTMLWAIKRIWNKKKKKISFIC